MAVDELAMNLNLIKMSKPDYDMHGLAEAYAEPQRVYHGMGHIKHMLEACKELNEMYAIGVDLYVAAWFHDAVYVIGAKNNEELSAGLALWRTGNKEIAQAVVQTAHHRFPKTLLAACLIDADLCGLGTDAYDTNTAKVKAEYGDIPEELWIQGRKAFLRSYLSRPNLFWTAWGAQYEAPARENMTRELDSLV